MFILLTGDVGSHYGAVDSIVKTGFAGMHYPYLHIESAILEMITNIPHDQIINLVPVFYVLIFLCGVNLVIYKLTKNLQIRLLSLFISALLPFGCSQYSLGSWSLSMFIPYLAGFLVSVFILYFIFCLYDTRYRDWQNRVLLLLILMQIAVIF